MGLTELTQEQLQQYIQSKGAIAPIIFIAVSFLQVTLVPIPGSVTIIAGNYLFGPLWSFVYSYIGMLLGAMFAFFLGKVVGRPFANWLAGGKDKVDEWLIKLRGKEKVTLFFMFFFPFFPDDILCTVAGLMPISYGGFFVMQVITRATSIAATLFFMSGEIIPWSGWGLVLLVLVAVVCIVAFVIAFINAEKIDAFFNCLTRKVYYKNKYFMGRQKDKEVGKWRYVGEKIQLNGIKWSVAAAYLFSDGITVDIYSPSSKILKLQNVNFDAELEVDGFKVQPEYAYEINYYGKKLISGGFEQKKGADFVKHYRLPLKSGRKFLRVGFKVKRAKERMGLALILKTAQGQIQKINLDAKKSKGIKGVVDLVKD